MLTAKLLKFSSQVQLNYLQVACHIHYIRILTEQFFLLNKEDSILSWVESCSFNVYTINKSNSLKLREYSSIKVYDMQEFLLSHEVYSKLNSYFHHTSLGLFVLYSVFDKVRKEIVR